jgi:hypothetical protein
VNTNAPNQPQNQTTRKEDLEEKEQQQQQSSINWENLIYGTDRIIHQPSELKSSEPIIESHSTPKKLQQPIKSSEEKSNPLRNSSTKQNTILRSRPIISSSSSPSSDTDSIVEYALHRPKEKHSSPLLLKQPMPRIVQPQTLRQDSQATLIDENLDDLSSQLKYVLLDQERPTLNTSTKEERTTDVIGSMSFPLFTPDILSTAILDNERTNRPNENSFRHLSNQRINYSQQRNRQTFDIPERSTLHRKKNHHHHHHHQRSSASHHIERTNDISPRKTDVSINILKIRLNHSSLSINRIIG